MKREEIKDFLADLRRLAVFPRRCAPPKGATSERWIEAARRYNNEMKKMENSDFRWRVIEYHDGRKELAYLRVRRSGVGGRPAIYRGLVFPRRMERWAFFFVKRIRVAF